MHYGDPPHLVHGYKVYGVVNRILLEFSTVDSHGAHILTAHNRGACQGVTGCHSTLAPCKILGVWYKGTHAIFVIPLNVFLEPCRQVQLIKVIRQNQDELKWKLIRRAGTLTPMRRSPLRWLGFTIVFSLVSVAPARINQWKTHTCVMQGLSRILSPAG